MEWGALLLVMAVVAVLLIFGVVIAWLMVDPLNKIILGQPLGLWDMLRLVLGVILILKTIKVEVKIE